MLISLHSVSVAEYVLSTKKHNTSTNTLVGMICHRTSDTPKQSSCIHIQPCHIY